MNASPGAEELLAQLGLVATEEDLAVVRAAAVQEAIRLRHPTLLRGHLLSVLVRSGADPALLEGLGIQPGTTAIQLADLVRAEADALAAGSPEDPGPVEPSNLTRTAKEARTPPCPECGDTAERRFQTRRLPNPEGRGSVTARVAVCGACGTTLGVG